MQPFFIMKRVIQYLYYLIREFLKPLNYVTSILVGGTINSLVNSDPFYSLIPYIVPFIIQSLSKSSIHYKNRDRDTLLLLPLERKDPAFLTTPDGTILINVGLGDEILSKKSIKNIRDFIDIKPGINEEVEIFSPVTKRWYRVDSKSVKERELYWLTDITLDIRVRERIKLLKDFNKSIMDEVDNLVYKNDVYDKLATIILNEGYKGIVISKLSSSGNKLSGYVYKGNANRVIKSSRVEITIDSRAPLTSSRDGGSIVTDSLVNYKREEDFFDKNPFNKNVTEFLGFRIFNFINYHIEEVSIIAFNKKEGIGDFDKRVMVNIVDSTRIIDTLVHLAKSNDNRFLESIEGLCAAAEFSDEITGKHIYRVNRYSELIAIKIGLDEKSSIWLGQVAAIHDIGKVAMPELIKIEGVYTKQERLKMQMHTVIGANIIKKMMIRSGKPDKRLLLAREIALLHHQEWCGKGYPGIVLDDGSYIDEYVDDHSYYEKLRPLKGDEIPVEALIVSLADRYDALRSPRHYKPGFSHEKTMEILKRDDRTGRTGEDVFGPVIYSALLEIHNEMDSIYESMKD